MNQNIKKLRTYFFLLIIATLFGAQHGQASRLASAGSQEMLVEKLVQHMEKRIVSLEKEKFPWERFNLINSLADLHTHAYALKIDKVKADSYKEAGKEVVWFPLIGVELKGKEHYYRQDVYPARGEAQAVEAKRHLQEAMRWYKYLIQADSRKFPNYVIGLAWCLQQAGQTEDAKKEFFKIYQDLKVYLASEKVTETLTYVFKIPFSEGMTHFEILRNEQVVSKENIYLRSFVHAVVGDSVSNGLYFANEADQKAIKAAIAALEDKFEEASIVQRNARSENIVQLYKRALVNAADKENTASYNKLGLPAIVRAKELLVDGCRGAKDAKCQMVMAMVDVDPQANLKVGAVKLWESATKFEKNSSKVSLSERKGPKKNYKFQLVSENGVVGETIQEAVPAVESNESYGPVPVDFTISSRRRTSGYGEAMYYYSQILDKTKNSKELEDIRQALWIESKKVEKDPHVLID